MKSLTSFVPVVRQHHQFSFGDHLGSISAQQDILIQALRHDQVGYVNVLNGSLLMHSHGWPTIDNQVEASKQVLGQSLFHRIRNFSIPEAIDKGELGTTTFLSRVQDFPNFAMLRRHLNSRSPICAIVHSILIPELILRWLAICICSIPCDFIVATSTSAEMAISKLFEKIASDFPHVKGIEWPKVRRIPLGVEEDTLADHLTRESARAILQLPQEVPIVLYNGRISHEYKADLEPLILAVARLQQRFSKIVLCIAGHEQSNDYSKKLSNIAKACGIGESVRFIVNYPRNIKGLIYRSADVFVSPVDNYQETFGLSLLEAMAAGLPVVASDWSGYRDIVEDGVTGFLVKTVVDSAAGRFLEATSACCPPPITEAILASRTIVDVALLQTRLNTLLADRDLSRQFGEKGKSRVQAKFLWKNVITQFGELWHEQHSISQGIKANFDHIRSLSLIFDSYATSYLDERNCILSCGLSEFQQFQKLYGTADPRFAILGFCLQPQTFTSLLQRFGSGVETALLSLLKKDLFDLSISRSNSYESAAKSV